MGDHASDGPPKNLTGGSEVIRSSFGVAVHAFAQESEVLQLVPVKRTGHVEHLASEIGSLEK